MGKGESKKATNKTHTHTHKIPPPQQQKQASKQTNKQTNRQKQQQQQQQQQKTHTQKAPSLSSTGSHHRLQSNSFARSSQVLNEKRPLARAVLVVITDGANSTRKSTNEAARMLREDDVRMVWLYITQNGTTAMWREKLRMSAAGDTTLEVLTFDDLGQDDVRHILVATCRGERLQSLWLRHSAVPWLRQSTVPSLQTPVQYLYFDRVQSLCF